MRRTLVLLLVLAGVALTPAAALATTRYAAPSGAGGGPCTSSGQACTLTAALASAARGDDVSLASGLYENPNANAAIQVPAGVTVHGTRGPDRPTIDQPNAYTSCTTCADVALGDGAALRDVEVRQTPAGAGAISAPSSATIDGVLADGSRRALAITARGASTPGVVRDSALSCSAASCRALVVLAASPTPTLDLRNVTVVATGAGSTALEVDAGTVTASNAIFDGTQRDVNVLKPSSGTSSASLHYSSFTPGRIAAAAGTSLVTSDHPVGPAAFVDLAGGDLHESPGSPTIDAGTTAVGPSNGDLDGGRRTIGAAPDVGAYELLPAPGLAQVTLGTVTRSTAAISANVDPFGAATVVIVQWGPSVAYGYTQPVSAPPVVDAMTPVSATLHGLVAGATYHFRVVAFSDGGLSATSDATVTTLGPPRPPPPARQAGPRRRQRCVVPRLTGLTQRAAAHRLAVAHCRLGRVTRPRGRVRGRLVVLAQGRRAGTRAPARLRVAVRLGLARGPRTLRRSTRRPQPPRRPARPHVPRRPARPPHVANPPARRPAAPL